MVNVIKNHTLFPTIVHEFEHIANEQLLNAVQNEDVKSEMVYHTGHQWIIIYTKNQSIKHW